MDITARVQSRIEDLRILLDEITAPTEGTVTPGSAQIVGVSDIELSVQFPTLLGTFGGRRVLVTFSIVSDFGQAVKGRPVNKSSLTEEDYLRPFVQMYTYREGAWPFVLCITPEHRDVVTKFMTLLGMAPREIEVGWDDFDSRFFLDCASNEDAAAGFLGREGVRASIEAISPFVLLRFEGDSVKLVLSGKRDDDYTPERLLACLDRLGSLIEQA